MNAKEYLEFLQSSFQPDDAELAYLAAETREWGAIRSKQFGTDMTSTYDRMADRSSSAMQTEFVVNHLLPPLLSVLPSDLRAKVESVPVGVLPLRTVNACAAKAPNGEPVVMLDSGLFSMSHFYHETQATMYSLMQTRGYEASIRYNEAAYKFILNYYDQSGRMSFPKPRTDTGVSVELMAFATAKAVAIECFVLAHELSHILSGHLDDAATESATIASGTPPLDFYQKSQEQELKADAGGLLIYQLAADSMPILQSLQPPLRKVAPIEFFQLAGLVEANLKNHSEYSTHPPTKLRVGNLLLLMKERGADEETFECALGIAQIAMRMPTLGL